MFLSTHCAAPSAAVFQREAQGYPDHSQPPAADSCRCVHRLRQNQFYICAACHSGTRGIRIHHHAILYRVAAGCNHRALALNFHTADTAGGNFIDSLQVAKMRDFYIDRLRRLHNRRSCRHLRKLSINRYSYHSPVLPPLKLPKPK